MGRITRMLGLPQPVPETVASLDLVRREVAPLEGTRMSLFNSVIPDFWSANGLSSSSSWMPGSAQLAERVWVANRCNQLNAQQVASMPLIFHGADEPAWVSAPDPNWYPNGVGDALQAMVEAIYGWGYVCLQITSRYADGFPRTWTVLDSASVSVQAKDGARVYKVGERPVPASDIVQIDRNPGARLHGTSALRAYAQTAWGLLAAGNQSMSVNQGGVPTSVLKPKRPVTKEQAEALQAQWAAATTARNGLPPVLPPDLEFETISFNPSDLALLDTQEFNARAIASAFGVPAMLLNMPVTGGLTYQNPAALGEMWWRFELRPTATRIANALSAQLLPRGQWVSFDAADTFAELSELSDDNDEQAAQTPPGVAKASPAQQPRPLTAIGGGGG